MPLADKYRPTRIEDVVGQNHIIGKGKLLNNMIEKTYFPNMIFLVRQALVRPQLQR